MPDVEWGGRRMPKSEWARGEGNISDLKSQISDLGFEIWDLGFQIAKCKFQNAN
jgi:hypothetical protein